MRMFTLVNKSFCLQNRGKSVGEFLYLRFQILIAEFVTVVEYWTTVRAIAPKGQRLRDRKKAFHSSPSIAQNDMYPKRLTHQALKISIESLCRRDGVMT